MKKVLLIFTLLLGMIFTFSQKIGANMSTNYSQVRAEHILVKTEQEAKDIKAQIESGKITFEDAAKEYSKCPSKANGGDLGYFGRGMMVKPFEEASFNGKTGEIPQEKGVRL